MEHSVERHLRQVEQRYRRIAAQLTAIELQAEREPDDLRDLFGPARHAAGSRLFVGYYSLDGLRDALHRYGFLQRVAEAVRCQEADLQVRIDVSDPYHHVLQIHRGAPDPGALLVELRLHLQDHPGEAVIPRAAGFVCSEWLLLQNPTRPFTVERPRLPGQLHPGLGVGAEVQTLLTILTERLGRHGLLAYPAFYHTAALYAARFRFVDPVAEGRFRALRRDGAGLPLDVLSWAVELGCVRDSEGAPFEWLAREELLPVSPSARAYFETPEYVAVRDAAEEAASYTVDLPLLDERRPQAEAEAEALGRRAYEAAQRAHAARR